MTKAQTTSSASTYSETFSSQDTPISISSSEVSTRNYLMGKEAKLALLRGIRAVNDAVAATSGPGGRDGLLGAFEWPYTIATNDGASIAERVKCDDPFEQMGVRLLQESIGRANKESGDGSTTTSILTAAILEEGMKYENVDFKKELNDCLPFVLDSLDKQAKAVSMDEVWKVATVSAQDEEMGKMIGEIYKQIGKDGVVVWDNSNGRDTSYEIRDGIELHGVTFAHPSLINAHTIKDKISSPMEGNCIVVNNPHILITAEKINKLEQIEPYMRGLRDIGELVVLCDEIEPYALAQVEATAMGLNLKGGGGIPPFKVVILRAPTLWKDWIYEDFARMTGATIFGVGQAAQLKGAASLSWLGTCEKIVAKRDGTIVIGTKDISDHIATLAEAAKEHREYEKRVEWLNSKSAIVKMGARSEVELTYKRLKFEDARASAKLALQEGVVVGGGFAFCEVAKGLPDTVGGKILKKALVAPRQQIESNMRKNLTEKDVAEVQDPVLVMKNAISAAISVAGTVLNAETLVPYEQTQKYK